MSMAMGLVGIGQVIDQQPQFLYLVGLIRIAIFFNTFHFMETFQRRNPSNNQPSFRKWNEMLLLPFILRRLSSPVHPQGGVSDSFHAIWLELSLSNITQQSSTARVRVTQQWSIWIRDCIKFMAWNGVLEVQPGTANGSSTMPRSYS